MNTPTATPDVPTDLQPSSDSSVPASSVTPDNEESPVCMVTTACGDYHNLGLDSSGQAYSLPSPLHFSSMPGGAQPRVKQVVCGKVRNLMG